MNTPPQQTLIAASQLGYTPDSPKTVTLSHRDPDRNCIDGLPERVPYIVRGFGQRTPRKPYGPGAEHWPGTRFGWPFFVDRGPWRPEPGTFTHRGELTRLRSDWGTFWQDDFTAFRGEGVWQIETEFGTSPAFRVAHDIHDRLTWGFLQFIKARRCSYEQPGISRADHLDDAVLDSTGRYLCTTGGWYDAGDCRKWLSQTQFITSGLAAVHRHGHAAFRGAVEDEIAWGNRYFHAMLNAEGRVYEDVAGGEVPEGFDIETQWWFENHPGCIADGADDRLTDNIRHSGDERRIRDRYNAWTQYGFVRNQAIAATVLAPADAVRCLHLAERAWAFAADRGHDQRTLFLSGEIGAAVALLGAESDAVDTAYLTRQVEALLDRQESVDATLSGYFLEDGGQDAYRSIAYPAEPVIVLLDLLYTELHVPTLDTGLRSAVERAVRHYLDDYLLADMQSNPFGLCPYGVYLAPPSPERQRYRDAGLGRGVRSFIHPFNEQQIAHGTLSAVMQQAHALARAAATFGEPRYRVAAERLLQWGCGHNPAGMCQFLGVGSRCPVPFSSHHYHIPECCVVGFNGFPDDRPHIEESTSADWTTQEVWTVPYSHAVQAVAGLEAIRKP